MEFPVEIVLAIAWVLLALLRKRARAGRAASGAPDVAEASEPITPDESLERLLRQFGLEVPAPPEPERTPVEAKEDTPLPGGFEHERHGFGAENPFSEQSFENRPAFTPRKPAPPVRSYDPHALRSTPEPTRRPSTWAQRLSTPEAARDALVLTEILERRGGRRQPRR